MKMYNVQGIVDGHEIVTAVIYPEHPHTVCIELWYENGKEYAKIYKRFRNYRDYVNLLYRVRPATIARRYLKELGLKVKEAVY
ncbi:MAG: hypothetical protein DRJ03_22155 [Chloroflexi bacterium]|nr:MAG: hypothetical protein DRJ03_22155 [Chloroflexota bacterium]